MIFAIFDQGEVGFNEIFDLNPDENTSYLESLAQERLRSVPKWILEISPPEAGGIPW